MEVCAGFELIAIENTTTRGDDLLEIGKGLEAQMIRHMRHGSSPRLMALQPIRVPDPGEPLTDPISRSPYYSLDLRARIVGHVRAGHSRRDAARHFRVSASCAVKLLKRADRTGSAEPAHRGRPRGSGKLAAHQAFLIGRVEAQPAMPMPELAAALAAERGVIASPASLARVLCQAGFTYKKTADGLGARTRRCPGATTGVDRKASAPHAASAGTPGVHRRDRGHHEDDAAARAQPSRTALARFGAVRPLGHPDLHRCAQV